MLDNAEPTFTAFAGARRIDSGALAVVATAVKRAIDAGESREILVFDDSNARTVEIDFRGAPSDVQASAQRALRVHRAAAPTRAVPREGSGRPKLGVAREVTLLTRHWNWLAGQPGGASAALRRLVEEAAKDRDGRDRRRLSQEAVYRFVSSLAGDRVHYEDAVRALFAGDASTFARLIGDWPKDVADYALQLSTGAFRA